MSLDKGGCTGGGGDGGGVAGTVGWLAAPFVVPRA